MNTRVFGRIGDTADSMTGAGAGEDFFRAGMLLSPRNYRSIAQADTRRHYNVSSTGKATKELSMSL
jgi:hypothetical protein